MPTPAPANVVFLPWVRQSAAGAITVVDTLGSDQRATVDLSARIAVNTEAGAPVPVRLRGPADVIGIDPHEIVRTDPQPGSADFEPNYFAAIEFDRADFPWLFTPAKADASARLRPWLCLVVVRQQDGVILRSTSQSPLPALEIAAPAVPKDELPDLSECWLWAHTQAVGASSGTGSGTSAAAELRATLGGNPELSLSRLWCPRLLAPLTDYIACVVPTFELGRKAGLGLEITEIELTSTAGLKPAWSLTPAPAIVTLPVYHHWRFRTNEGGDFESLVRLLQARTVPAGLGKRLVDISTPGFTLPATFPAGTTLALEGALQPMDAGAVTPFPTGTDVPFQTELAKIVNTPGLAAIADPTADPLLAPPLYGRWHAARPTVTRGAAPWFDELNLDPRHRSVAAFGTRVIQEHQEALMAAAWDQAADLQHANQRLRQLQLSLVASTSLHTRHFKAMSEEKVLRVGSPAFARLRAGAVGDPSARTLMGSLKASRLPERATSAAMRRIGRERGPISRRVASQGTARSATLTWVARLNTTESATFVSQPWMDIVTVKVVRDRIPLPSTIRAFEVVTEAELAFGMGAVGFQVAAEGQPVSVSPVIGLPQSFEGPEARIFRTTARTHLARINPGRTISEPTPPAALAITDLRASLLAQIEPARTLVRLASAIVSTGANATPPASTAPTAPVPIDTIMAAPTFTQPMYEPLRDLSQELLLPGLETVLPNTVLGLQTNRRFVEAYMVGLNFEMGRELLWRGFPTDQRGTCFDRFWDSRGAPAGRADVKPLHTWLAGPLGGNEIPPARQQFVMLLRSDLLRRYPTAVIYAVKAVVVNGVRQLSTSATDEVPPAFRGSLPPDVSFFGFDLTVEDVIGDTGTGDDGTPSVTRRPTPKPGYFIVIQEQPTEPRFGLDVGTPVGTGAHLNVGTGAPAGIPLNGLVWGRNAAHMAGILRQQPVRIAIHASQFVSKPAPGGLAD